MCCDFRTNNAMTAQYNTVPPDNRQWHVTESCAVRIEDGTWCRGIVKAVAGNNVKVKHTQVKMFSNIQVC